MTTTKTTTTTTTKMTMLVMIEEKEEEAKKKKRGAERRRSRRRMADMRFQLTVTVIGKALAGLLGKALHHLIVEAQIEDSVHHPRHGDGGARADRDEKWCRWVSKLHVHLLLNLLEGVGNVVPHAVGKLLAVFVVFLAHLIERVRGQRRGQFCIVSLIAQLVEHEQVPWA